MKTKKQVHWIVLVLITASLLISGCVEKENPVGGNDTLGDDKDEHGCIGSAGYTWCEAKQKCLRTWEEDCVNETIVGGDKDEHGCIGSAGYAWCAAKQKCLRTWEEDCPVAAMSEDLCRSAGGNWNECSNKCQLDNQGKQGVACTMQCEALCECAGIAGFNCPEGYACKAPKGVADALGYCVKESTGQKACTEEAKICPDGTAVGRVGPDCEFAPCPGEKMTIEDAMEIAQKSECAQKGKLTKRYAYNEYSGTWWIDLDMRDEFKKDYCNPACVVSDGTKTAEINWRCTGVLLI